MTLASSGRVRVASHKTGGAGVIRVAAWRDRVETAGVRQEFEEQGFYGPLSLLTRSECSGLFDVVRRHDAPLPIDWSKGHAASSRAFFEVATHPAILERVVALLGDDILLWGASVPSRAPGAVHFWHSDIEVTDRDSKTVAVWIGLRDTTPESSLFVVSRSHLFETIQEVRYKESVGRGEVTDDQVLAWARERDERSDLLLMGMDDGEALFFDGRMWHSSNNLGKETRHALLLQYATPASSIRIPDLNQLDWPFHRLEVPRPPCIVVRGRADERLNRLVTAPVARHSGAEVELKSMVHPLEIPLPDRDQPWAPHHLFDGATADIHLTCHASTLRREHSPHPPHSHVEEEILMVLAGEVELDLPEVGPRRLRPGGLVFYPAHFPHTLRTLSRENANYIMFKWSGATDGKSGELGFQQHDLNAQLAAPASGFDPRLAFEGRTGILRKLHVHATALAPGAGYEPHADAYDVAIVVLEGEIETLGRRVAPHGVVFYRAGESHGMSNPTGTVAKYLVVEFHGERTQLSAAFPPRPPRPSLTSLVKRLVIRVLPARVVARLRRTPRSR